MKFNVSLNGVNIETVGGASCCKAAHMSSRSCPYPAEEACTVNACNGKLYAANIVVIFFSVYENSRPYPTLAYDRV